jgi:carbon storage regulator
MMSHAHPDVETRPGIIIRDDIVVWVLAIEGDRVKIGIEAPRSVGVLREELCEAVRDENRIAVGSQIARRSRRSSSSRFRTVAPAPTTASERRQPESPSAFARVVGAPSSFGLVVGVRGDPAALIEGTWFAPSEFWKLSASRISCATTFACLEPPSLSRTWPHVDMWVLKSPVDCGC